MLLNLLVTETKWDLQNMLGGDTLVTGSWGGYGIDLDNLDYDEVTERVAKAAGIMFLENVSSGSTYVDSIDGIQWEVIMS